jgi:predicted solute-binding protein
MSLSKLTDKLEEFFNLSKSKQKKKHDKLLKIIQKLYEKKSSLEHEMIIESEINETSEKFNEVRNEFNAVSKLLKKAKKKSALNQEE